MNDDHRSCPMHPLTLPNPSSRALAVLAGIALAATTTAQRTIREFVGLQSQTQSGTSIAPAGDVDGDGYDDLIVGAPGLDLGVISYPGLVIVYSGADGRALVASAGSRPGMRLGCSVARLGDVDGDGVVDFAAGAPYDDWAGNNAGYVRVFSGANGSVIWERTGELRSHFGTALCAVGDLDGDGAPDLAIGRPRNTNVSPYGGVFFHSGRTGAFLMYFVGLSEDQFGTSLACPGDLSGDGKPDLLVGVPGFDYVGLDSGAVYALGLDGTRHPTILWNRHEGLGAGGGFGSKLAVLADVDHDGVRDVLASGAGTARVVSGRSGAILRAHGGDWNSTRYGTAVSGLGDFDGDGHADYAIGAPRTSGNRGAVQVRSGASGAVITTILGSADSWFGYALAAIGDLDGDGFAEVAVGAPDYDVGTQTPGRTSIHGFDVVGQATPFGVGCSSGTNGTMLLAGSGDLRFGGRLRLDLTRGRPFQPVMTFIGLSRTHWGQTPLPLPLDLIRGAGCHLLASIDLLLPPTTATMLGVASVNVNVPADPSLVGGVVYAQALGGFIGMSDVSASNGLEIRIGNL